MALKITKNQGIFEINGPINTKNAKSLFDHFEQLLETSERIILSLDHVNTIDVCGINALTSLYKTAVKKNKVFSIIGKENNAIKRIFARRKIEHIIRRDVV
ncbi:STAS domain-containing protein [Aquimarina hainanensis]|uniref:STAS domain-containing protein n=1 Tax=Aquimarina hainanensis TaxID=1578017 RepID=A0ABW5N5T9_9FLAO|nr:STAS domain-containing protein [Aquimarina sp. TRL1]QKX03959.1 STAS domain-containing protein [Aquimarina sp. TRL1]